MINQRGQSLILHSWAPHWVWLEAVSHLKRLNALRTGLFWVTALEERAIHPPGSLNESKVLSSSKHFLIYTNTLKLNHKVLC